MTLTVLAIVAVIALSVAIGPLRGLSEGITMSKPTDAQHRQDWIQTACTWERLSQKYLNLLYQFDLGPRGHRWFQFYHALDGTKDGLLILLGVAFYWTYHFVGLTNMILTGALSLAIIWLFYEPAYSYGRYARFDNGGNPEHVTLLDLFHWYVPVAWMTAFRLGLAILFAALMGGMA